MRRLKAPAPEDLRHEVERLGGPAASGRLAVAVSGGADSLALLRLAAQAFPGRLEAMTVDHALRPEARAEAEAVARICRSIAVPHAILIVDAPLETSNLQAAARAARYRLMAERARATGVGALLTAHHADDQAETLLMRLNRGSGLAGLSGVRARQQLFGIPVLRPVLGVRRAALRTLLEDLDWPVAEDPSNRDERFDRARARRLLENGGLDAPRAAASAAHLAEADEALEWAVARAWESRVTPEGRLDLEGLPDELARRLLARVLEERGASPRGTAVARLLARGGGTLGGVRAACRNGVWHLSPAPRRRPR